MVGRLAEEGRAHPRDKGGDIASFSVKKVISDVCMAWDGEMQHECPYDICSKFITEAVEENMNHDGCDMEDDIEADRWGTDYLYVYK